MLNIALMPLPKIIRARVINETLNVITVVLERSFFAGADVIAVLFIKNTTFQKMMGSKPIKII